ncbi:MAG: site-specific integrase [Bacteroidota bacterium]|nr:site-specific integrase [Bacteroidota bacterium]
MKVAPILWTHYEKSDGTYALKIKHSYGKNKDYYPLGITLRENQWDGSRVKNHPNATDINLKLIEIENVTERECLKDPNTDIGALIQKLIQPSSGSSNTLAEYFDTYVDLCRKGTILRKKAKTNMTDGYLKTFETTRSHIQVFETELKRKFTFNHITESWHNDYVHYMRHEYYDARSKRKGLSENTIAKDVKNIKTIMAYSRKKAKLHTNFEYEDFDAAWHEADKIALTEDEIDKIFNLDTEEDHPDLRQEQERFIVAYNLLLRFGDSIKINKNHIFFDKDQPFFKMVTGKTKQEVIIPLMKRTYNILKKNKFIMPATTNAGSNRILKRLGLHAKINDNYTVTINRQGKTFEESSKRYELMTTHTTRRSAATNLYLGGMDLESIRIIGGWKSIDQVRDYIKVDKMENAKRIASSPFFNK